MPDHPATVDGDDRAFLISPRVVEELAPVVALGATHPFGADEPPLGHHLSPHLDEGGRVAGAPRPDLELRSLRRAGRGGRPIEWSPRPRRHRGAPSTRARRRREAPTSTRSPASSPPTATGGPGSPRRPR